MTTALPETLQPIVNLAIARELFILDHEQEYMPPQGVAQRGKLIATIDTLLDDALYKIKDDAGLRVPEPTGLDETTSRAWNHLRERQSSGNLAANTYEGTAYQKLKKAFEERNVLDWSIEISDWHDILNLAKLPTQVIADAEQGIRAFMHKAATRTEIGSWIQEVKDGGGLPSPDDARNFALMERIYEENTCLTPKLIADLVTAGNKGRKARKDAEAIYDGNAVSEEDKAESAANISVEKRQKAFEIWKEGMDGVLEPLRTKAQILATKFNVDPYEALIQTFNKELRLSTVTTLFGEMKEKLPPLIERIMEKQALEEKVRPTLPLPKNIPPGVQLAIAESLFDKLGVDRKRVRLDPIGGNGTAFSNGQWDDLRIITHTRNLQDTLIASIHELGHTYYSLELPKDKQYQPIGNAANTWLHETQSLFWEREIFRTPEFMQLLSPIIQTELKKAGIAFGQEVGPENLYKLFTRVKPGTDRIKADEVTYHAHILLRTDLEPRILKRTLPTEEIPKAWADSLWELLHVKVPNDKEGCLRDTRWPGGSFGAAPAYTLGALGASQLMETLEATTDVKALISKGDFAPIKDWLKKHIFQEGSRYSAEELMVRATGKPLSIEPWLKHMQARYLSEPHTERGDPGTSGRWSALRPPEGNIAPRTEQPRGEGRRGGL